MNQEAIRKVIEQLSLARQYQQAAWNRVLEFSRAYAQLESYGTYEDKGRVIIVPEADKAELLKTARVELDRQILNAYAEDARMGREVFISAAKLKDINGTPGEFIDSLSSLFKPEDKHIELDPKLEARLREWFNNTLHEMGKEQWDSLLTAVRGS